ncbi:MAG: BREX-3 system P-loop-containing protein BrxF [Acidiferrobacter sp.]
MLEKLERLVIEVAALHSKLILLIGPPRVGKTALLAAFGKLVEAEPLNVGPELGRRLAVIPRKQRHLQASTELRVLADKHAKGDLLLMDNIELLFDTSLQLNPLELLKRHAHSKRVVAVWPGKLRDGRLTYADMGHSEYRDYATEGLVAMEVQ